LYDSSDSIESKDNSGRDVGSDEVYKERAKPVLVFSSGLYLELGSILIDGSGIFLVCFLLSTNYLNY